MSRIGSLLGIATHAGARWCALRTCSRDAEGADPAFHGKIGRT